MLAIHGSVRVQADSWLTGAPRLPLSPPTQTASTAPLLKLGTDRHAIDEQAIGLVNQDKYANWEVIME
jgi:hypothetical protein